MKLNLRSSTVYRIVEYGSYLYYFTAAGVEAVDPVTRLIVAYADIANTTCGAVNSNGVYIGTTAGVYLLALDQITAGGNRTANIVLKYSTATTPALPSNAVRWLDGVLGQLGVASGAGVSYLPNPTTVYNLAVTGGSSKVALGLSFIAWERDGHPYMTRTPTGDWVYGIPVSGAQVPSLLGYTWAFKSGAYSACYGTNTIAGFSHTTINGIPFLFETAEHNDFGLPVAMNAHKLGDVEGARTLTAVSFNDTNFANRRVFRDIAGCPMGYCAVAGENNSYGVGLYKYSDALVQFVNLNSAITGGTITALRFVNSSHLVMAGNNLLRLYKRTGDAFAFVASVAGGGTNHSCGLETYSNHIVQTQNGTIYYWTLEGDTLTVRGTAAVSFAAKAMSDISENGYFVVTDPTTANGGQAALYKLDITLKTLAFVCAIPTNGVTATRGKCAMHPSGRYFVIPRMDGQPAMLYSNNAGTVTYIAAHNLTGATTFPNSATLFMNNTTLVVRRNTYSSGYIDYLYTSSFVYDAIPSNALGTVVNDMAAAGGMLFVGTNQGVIIEDTDAYAYSELTGIFGSSSNVSGISITPDAKVGKGILTYGTSAGDDSGQLGVINLRNNFSLATRAGDQDKVYSAGLEVVCYRDEMERIEDAVSSTRKLVLLGTSVKRIVKHGAYMFHFTEAGLDVHRISDGVRVCWANVANVTCGAVNDNGVYIGTSTLGVKKLTHTAIANGVDQTAAVTVEYSTSTSPSIQANNILDLAGYGTALAVATGVGCDFLPTAAVVWRRVVTGGTLAVAIDATRFAYAEGGRAYFRAWPTADWVVGDCTAVPNLLGTLVNAQKFGADLFVATNDGITALDTAGMTTKNITTDLGISRNVVSLHPVTTASKSTGLVAYGLSLGAGSGKFGVIDMSILA